MPKKTAKKKSKPSSLPAHKHPHYRRRLLLWFLLFLCVTLLFVEVYKSQNSMIPPASRPVFLGTFSGKTPCADCEGIQTALSLSENPNTYSLTLTYLGKEVKPYVEMGTWTTEANKNTGGNTVYLLTPNGSETITKYEKLNSTQIRQLDMDGTPIPESLPFTLTKTQ